MNQSLVFHSNSELLEGPVFDIDNNYLYFVSIFDYLVYFYDPQTKEILSIKLDSPVSCIYLLEKKKVLVASKNGFYEVDFNTLKKKYVFQIDIKSSVRYNDGIKDPKGRYIIGTMGYPEVQKNLGEVFSYENGQFKTIIKNTTISNGLAFSEDYKWLYFIDTPTKKVAKYTYDINTGEVVFVADVISFIGEGSPDGMCMDKDGMLWIAEWGGACVSQWNPNNGEKIKELKLPCTNVTACCIDNHGNLYVTTAKSDSVNDIYGGGLYYLEIDKI
ncbi:SMP-30/gluconolactonase/LRE family protein [Maribacter sp. Asnod1-A12]|uniref:SMP-30/gluconolactonase/LRE family protein n=1 Tax=Maribacter sp. Asnod1-A12 TaxID=3160576 RepID=UPI00386997FB